MATNTYDTIQAGWDSLDKTFIVKGEWPTAWRREYEKTDGLYGGTAPHNGAFPPQAHDAGSRYFFGDALATLLSGAA